jgi:hypothetical protein
MDDDEKCCCCAACHDGPRDAYCCPGWFVNAETNEIERCDECALFATDDDAIAHCRKWSLIREEDTIDAIPCGNPYGA